MVRFLAKALRFVAKALALGLLTIIVLIVVVLGVAVTVSNSTAYDLKNVEVWYGMNDRPVWQGDLPAGESKFTWGFSGATIYVIYDFGDRRVSNRCSYLTGILDGYQSFVIGEGGEMSSCDQVERE
jgi:hypothetical protein